MTSILCFMHTKLDHQVTTEKFNFIVFYLILSKIKFDSIENFEFVYRTFFQAGKSGCHYHSRRMEKFHLHETLSIMSFAKLISLDFNDHISLKFLFKILRKNSSCVSSV